MDLCEALAVGAGDVVALTGGGGKTAALYRLGTELEARGGAVVLSGTTRFTPPERGEAPGLTLITSRHELDAAVAAAASWPLTAATGWGSKGRLLPVDPAWIDALHEPPPDLAIIIEADGSAMRPFKAPGEHEPVVPARATVVVAVVGMDTVGRPLDDTHVHRPERVAAIAGIRPGETVTPEHVAAVLMHPDGGRKGVPQQARWIALLNKADSRERLAAAEAAVSPLRRVAERVVIAQIKRTPPVLAVLRGAPRHP